MHRHVIETRWQPTEQISAEIRIASPSGTPRTPRRPKLDWGIPPHTSVPPHTSAREMRKISETPNTHAKSNIQSQYIAQQGNQQRGGGTSTPHDKTQFNLKPHTHVLVAHHGKQIIENTHRFGRGSRSKPPMLPRQRLRGGRPTFPGCP